MTDVVIRRDRLPHVTSPLDLASGGPFAGGSADALALCMPGLFGAEVRGGREIVLDPVPGGDLDVLELFVSQAMLGCVLLQRGHFLLHAGSVNVGGRAAVIAGFSGQGKSTTAASLIRCGHDLLCDDIVPILPDHRVLPGPPRMNLRPATAVSLRLDSPTLCPPVSGVEKRRYYPAVRAVAQSVPLGRVYILAEGPLGVESLPVTEALVELVRHTYGIRIIRHVGLLTRHFEQVSQLLRPGLIRRLTRPIDLGGLAALARLIEDDMSDAEPAGTEVA
jgi:hypothetical protein